jgi:hypothetical protein
MASILAPIVRAWMPAAVVGQLQAHLSRWCLSAQSTSLAGRNRINCPAGLKGRA